MSPAAAMLATLDGALGAPGGGSQQAGIAAAAGLNDLLIRHGLTWDDVVAPGSRLAKLCGRLGSEYQAEREAAYGHAVRLLLSRRATWSDLARLPAALAREAAGRPLAVQSSVHLAPTRPSPARDVPHSPQRSAGRPAPRPAVLSPPEGDWAATVQRLRADAAWRSDSERALLAALEHGLAEGQAISVEEARWLRDIWWRAELNPAHEEATG